MYKEPTLDNADKIKKDKTNAYKKSIPTEIQEEIIYKKTISENLTEYKPILDFRNQNYRDMRSNRYEVKKNKLSLRYPVSPDFCRQLSGGCKARELYATDEFPPNWRGIKVKLNGLVFE